MHSKFERQEYRLSSLTRRVDLFYKFGQNQVLRLLLGLSF